MHILITVLTVVASLGAAKVASGECGGDFAAWVSQVRSEGASAGLSESATGLLERVQPDQRVLALDRSQKVFTQDWQTFAGRMVNAYRLKAGKLHLRQYADVFAQAEQAYGVPGPVIAAFWGLETDYGAVQGDFDTLGALATLAHDCRRPELFRPQLIAALRLVDSGYLTPVELKGAWAGELGQIRTPARGLSGRGNRRGRGRACRSQDQQAGRYRHRGAFPPASGLARRGALASGGPDSGRAPVAARRCLHANPAQPVERLGRA